MLPLFYHHLDRWPKSIVCCPMMNARYVGLGLLVLAALTGIGGCRSSQARARSSKLVVSQAPFHRDVPVPAGFRMVDQASEDWSNGSARYVRHEYRGPADKPAIRAFYRKQMPLLRWRLLDDSNVHGRIKMRFDRDGESCTISIEDHSIGWSSGVSVQVLVVPNAP